MLSQNEIRQNITNSIIESLKKGNIPWRKPWTGIATPRLPTNFVTKRKYSGVNIPILWAASQQRGFDVDYFATFNQWKSIGASVKKGEKAVHVILFKPIKRTVKDDDGTERVEQFPMMRLFPVFSIHSVQGGGIEDLLNQPAGPVFEHEQRDEFMRIVASTKADIRYGGSTAAYFREGDYIQMPEEGRFESFSAFAETLAHELGHFSEKRLGWRGTYSEGELRAELAAVFTCSAIMDVSQNISNHAAYIGSWLQALENDPKHIFRAAAAASRAADWILNGSSDIESENDTEAILA